MPITVEDVKLMASQRLADTTDGGGQMTGNEVVDGNVNNLFPDISRLDRVYGRVSLRKAFVHIDTADNDTYNGAHAILSVPASDPNVSVCLFTTSNPHDVRTDAVDRLESYVTLGPRFQGWLWGDQPAGSRSLMVFMPTSAEVPEVGDVLCLFNNKGGASEYRQYVRVMKVEAKEQSFTIGSSSITRKVLTIEIGDPLEVTFIGIEMMANDNTPTSIYTTIVSDAAKYYGVMIPRTPIASGDVNINVESIYTQLVPTSQAETPLLGLSPGEAGPIKKSGNSYTISFASQTWEVLNLGQAFVPGSLQLTVGSTVFADSGNGVLMQGSNQAGLIEYALGRITFSPSRAGVVKATFDPGCAMIVTPTTLMVPIQAATAGYNYVAIMWPPPQPGTIIVDYMAQGNWYRLRDDGTGFLVPDIPDTGTGRIDYAAGQLSLTCAAIPDIETSIIIYWSNPVELVQMQGVVEIVVDPVHHTLTGTPVAPGSLSITWPTGISATATATDDGQGQIIGDATGWINYGNGELEFTPTKLPVADSSYTFGHDKYAFQTHAASGASFILPDAPLKPGSVALQVPVSIGEWNHTYVLRDHGNGTMSAHGFFITLSQARAAIGEMNQHGSSGTGGTRTRPSTSEGHESSFLTDKAETTETLTAGGISATIDYITGAVTIDLSTATAHKNTITAKAIAKGREWDQSTVVATPNYGYSYTVRVRV